MKKGLLATMAALALVGATSCSSDDPAMGTTGQEVTVTVTASLPSDIQSRAFSDGETATKFFYAVYETDATNGDVCVINKTQGTDFSGLNTTLSLQLVTGKSYKMVFWAQSQASIDNGLFTVANDLSTITVNYEKLYETGTTLTMEDMDAFWCMKEVPVNGAGTVTAELKRPFAQINVGTNDIAQAAVAKKKIYTEMKVKEVYSSFNLLSGNVASDKTEVTFSKTLRPNDGVPTTDDTYEAFPVGDKGDYEYLMMAYVLMSPDKFTTDIDLDFYFDDESEAKNHLDVDGAPL